MQYYIGLDNGGTMVKAALFDENGKMMICIKEKLEMEIPETGWSERDMNKLWNANCRVIKRAVEIANIVPKDIRAVSFSGHGKGLYLVDAQGRPVRKGILSTDTRASGIMRAWEKDGTAKAMSEITRQGLMVCQPICLLKWLADNEAWALEHAKWIFGINDYIRYMMTGQAGGEMTNFSGAGIMDLDKKCISHRVLELAGLSHILEKFPPLLNPSEIAGTITKKAAEETGLETGTICAAGLFDIDACAIGMGITDHSRIAVLAGTWGINEYITKNCVSDETVRMNSCYCMDGWYLVEESSPTSAANFEWFVRNIVWDKWMGAQTSDGLYDYADHLAEGIDINENIPTYLPYLFGSPENANASGCLIGLNARHTYPHIIRSIMEGIVFCHKRHLEKLLRTRTQPSAVRLGGGVCGSDFWVQMFADILEIPVELQEGEEPGTLGAAMTAAIASGKIKDFEEAAKKMVHIKKAIYPNLKVRDIYRKKYENYCRTTKHMEGYWMK